MKKDIVLKEEHRPGLFLETLAEADQVRFKNALLRGDRVLFHQNKLNSFQQAYRNKGLAGCGPSVFPFQQGDAVNFVKKGPTIQWNSLFHVFNDSLLNTGLFSGYA